MAPLRKGSSDQYQANRATFNPLSPAIEENAPGESCPVHPVDGVTNCRVKCQLHPAMWDENARV